MRHIHLIARLLPNPYYRISYFIYKANHTDSRCILVSYLERNDLEKYRLYTESKLPWRSPGYIQPVHNNKETIFICVISIEFEMYITATCSQRELCKTPLSVYYIGRIVSIICTGTKTRYKSFHDDLVNKNRTWCSFCLWFSATCVNLFPPVVLVPMSSKTRGFYEYQSILLMCYLCFSAALKIKSRYLLKYK